MVSDNLFSPKQRRLGRANRNGTTSFKLKVRGSSPEDYTWDTPQGPGEKMAYFWQMGPLGASLENLRRWRITVIVSESLYESRALHAAAEARVCGCTFLFCAETRLGPL